MKENDKNLTESDVQAKLSPKNAFDYFCDNPAVYCSKLIKKNEYKEGTQILEEIIVKIESLPDSKIGKFDKDNCEVLAILVLLFFLFKLKMTDAFESILDKLEDKQKKLISEGKIDGNLFAFDYFTVLLWQSKGMERQAKERLHLLAMNLEKNFEIQPTKESIDDTVVKHILYFWVFGNSIQEQLKLVYFELNRLYMKCKDYR